MQIASHISFNFAREKKHGKSLHPLLDTSSPTQKTSQNTSANGQGLQRIMRIKKPEQYYIKQVTDFKSTLYQESQSIHVWQTNTNPRPGMNTWANSSTSKKPSLTEPSVLPANCHRWKHKEKAHFCHYSLNICGNWALRQKGKRAVTRITSKSLLQNPESYF